MLFPTGFSGKGLLSRMPLVTQEQLHLYPDRPDLHVRVETPGGALLVVVAHPPPPRVGWRGLVFDARAVRQIVSLARLASANPPGRADGGLQHDRPPRRARPPAPAGAAGRLRRRRAGAGGHPPPADGALQHGCASAPAPGWPPLFPVARVDYIWHTADLVALEAWVGADAGSDHLPVLARLAPAPVANG